MADEQKTLSPRTKKVFVNLIDSYSSKCIGKFLSNCIPGASLEDDEGEEENAITFQIVGTVETTTDKRGSRFSSDEYCGVGREDLLQRLMECDVIVYNISENSAQLDEASWAISALHSEINNFGGPKMFILISTVMTWALTKPIDPDDLDIPFTEEDYRRRRPHPNFKEHISIERLVLKMGKMKKSRLSTYVVAAGLQYGMGENIFHYFFRASWLGEVSRVPVFGSGSNVIPTIHVNDLAGLIQNIIDHKPKTHYLMAVDDSDNTFEDIVKTISSVLGPGKIEKVPKEEAFLIKDFTQGQIDSLSISLHTEAVFLKNRFNIHWVCESGMVASIDHVVKEYRQNRQLLPIRVCILGPPAVGKTTVAAKICKHYKIHHVTVKDAIAEKITQLEEVLQMDSQEDESFDALAAQELLDSLKDNMNQNGGRLDDQLVFQILREKLNSKPCRNQGFVLDGYPKTYDQAKEMFYGEEETEEDTKSKMPPFNQNIIPDYVFSLDATDEFLKIRVQNLPESMVEDTHYARDQFLRHLAEFRDCSLQDETVLDYFDELEIHPEHMEVTGEDSEYLAVTEKIIRAVGKAKNYGPSAEEQEEEVHRNDEEKIKLLAEEREERVRRDAEEAVWRAAQLEEWSKNRKEVKRQEQELLEARSIPLRNYLMKNVMPTVTHALIECYKIKPDDPVDFLAEYLLRNSALVD
ncbi:adenylate kinase 7-like isoform X1 [Conger conger]|uniref:adenylate kinase 7-like isoform X1 n=1 Tax=Conger conger TaxID=82655 RepID=UPI002A5AFAD7|nr:adenylate kinase 7-like isoform X1 [Conger conger]